jgi:hypothetical protein
MDPRRRPFYVMADGNQKLNHHAKCGQTITKVIEPIIIIHGLDGLIYHVFLPPGFQSSKVAAIVWALLWSSQYAS